METSTDHPEQRRREEEEETYCQYSPCYFCKKVIKAFRKCLGYDSTPVDLATYPPPSEAERECKFDEDIAVQSTRSLRIARKPRRPPVSTGGGGQIN